MLVYVWDTMDWVHTEPDHQDGLQAFYYLSSVRAAKGLDLISLALTCLLSWEFRTFVSKLIFKYMSWASSHALVTRFVQIAECQVDISRVS
jgi:hypothetical protein